MQWKIEIRYREDIPDAIGKGLVGDVQDLGITGVEDIRTTQVYWVTGEAEAAVIERLCSELLADAVTQVYRYYPLESEKSAPATNGGGEWIVEVRYKPGVTDTVGDSVMKGIRDMGISGIQEVHTGHQYILRGSDLSRSEVEQISKRLLANELIQNIRIWR